MTDFIAKEKGVPVREPSTANLMVDSVNRNNLNSTTSADFLINPNNSILNGFFTRLGVTEVVFDWNEPNITTANLNNTGVLDVSGVGTFNLTIPSGFYNVGSYIDAFLVAINDLSGTTTTAIRSNVSPPYLYATNNAVYWNLILSAPILSLNANVYVNPAGRLPLNGIADLRLYRYIDITSSQLTYNQELKDASTKGQTTRDVLCRWYMDWDNPPTLDKYGYPILMGYNAFNCRRLFSPPKQIKWEPNQPLGQLGFKLYTNVNFPFDSLTLTNQLTNWLMTIQVSEV
jgi:hypothetical protein